ncbi:fatty-acid amide hydrolase 2-A-like [Episyrphus balteatus]|uniref:fatty-acid amide hydrolase 2-A-like n=1 Tax=Episyrphus balteatus TaxID=286459 RepID=UPI002486A4EF|nr:fatty-acid amide hydrolase 2-A-like [Episyrphus balteatus]
MELLLRLIASFLHIVGIILSPIIAYFTGGKRVKIPPPSQPELTNIPIVDLVPKIRQRELKSEELVRAYVERIRAVNPILNAIVEDRCAGAIKDAQQVDQLIKTTPPEQLDALFGRHPLLGVPFTVKESCGLKGMSHVVGNEHRYLLHSENNGEAVELLRDAGCIPLLVSANPEFCQSWETTTKTHGRCNNPFDTRKTPGGSSGGEGALLGCGASPFGVGSDIAGSIRLPALFNGIFGHKPTGGLVSVTGHYPMSDDKLFRKYLQVGPMTRYARDLPLLLQIMSGSNADKLEFSKPIHTKDINIHYMIEEELTFTRWPVDSDFKVAILRAIKHFESNGMKAKEVKIKDFTKSLEITLASAFDVETPSILNNPNKPNHPDNVWAELGKSLIGDSKYSFNGLFLEVLRGLNGLIPKDKVKYWLKEGDAIKAELTNLLGSEGVLLIPTFHRTAMSHNTSVFNLGGVPFLSIFNIIGFPATHIPMGLNSDGIPIGFQVVAAPYKDKLCIQIAAELEAAFGGWVHPN